jgi:hypothetical protein
MTATNPRNLLAIALACGVYVLAYRHGQVSAPRPACDCGHAPSLRMREEEELLDSGMAVTERRMVNCLLERADTRAVVRRRLHVCLHQKGALDPASAARLMSPPASLLPPPTPPPLPGVLARGSSPSISSTVLAGAPPRKVASTDPLAEELRTSRENEELLPSTPMQGRPAANAAGGEVLTAAAAAATSGRLVSITCVANEKLLTLEPTSDWVQCGGDASSSAAELLDSVFVQVRARRARSSPTPRALVSRPPALPPMSFAARRRASSRLPRRPDVCPAVSCAPR